MAPYEGVLENPLRYTFWPQNSTRLPLLYVCALMVFIAPATSNANESFHSVAGYILRKQRNMLTPENAAAYALARVLMADAVKQSAELKAIDAEAEFNAGVIDETAVDEVLISSLSGVAAP
jgi:hypothetical protein